MNSEQQIEKTLRWLVFPLLALVYLVQAYAQRGLYGDGANFLLGILQSRDMPWWDRQRIFNHLITKTPTVLAIYLGMRDLATLRVLFSSWILFCPIFVWGLSLWSLRRDILFWPYVMFFCFVYFSTNFFAIGEYNLCFALLGFCFAQLIRPLPERKFLRCALLLAAFFLSLDYPATLFAGGLLFLILALKPKPEWNGAPRAYRITLMALISLSVASSLWEIIAPRDPGNFQRARHLDMLLLDKQFWCVLMQGWLVTLIYVVRATWFRVSASVLCIALFVVVLFDTMRLNPAFHCAIRAYMSLALAFCGGGLWLFRRKMVNTRRSKTATTDLLPATMAATILLSLSLFDMLLSVDHKNFLEAYRTMVNTSRGIVPYESSPVWAILDSDRFNWDWTNPLLSVILRKDASKGLILNPAYYHGYQPFDPLENIPDLDAYYHPESAN